MDMIELNIEREQFTFEQGHLLDCEVCKQKTIQYRLLIAESIMRRSGLYCKDTTPEEVYQFAIRNVEDRSWCYNCLLKKGAE